MTLTYTRHLATAVPLKLRPLNDQPRLLQIAPAPPPVKVPYPTKSKQLSLGFPTIGRTTNMAAVEENPGTSDCTLLDDVDEETIAENLRRRLKLGKVLLCLAGSMSLMVAFTDKTSRNKRKILSER